MKIGIDARFFGGEQSKGLGRYTQKLIEHLAEMDKHNEYVVFLQADGFEYWQKHMHHPQFTAVLAPYEWYTIAEQLYMPRLIWKHKVDFMHFPHFNVPLLYRGPFVVTIHDLIILRFPTKRATTLGPIVYAIKQAAGKMVLRHAVTHSSQIITVSEFSKKDIVDYYHIDPAKITVTYEAAEFVSPETVSAQPQAEILEKYNITKPYVLYVGNAYPHKNLERVIDSIAQLAKNPPAWMPQFVFVGKMDYFYERLRREVTEKQVEQYVVFTEFVPDVDLAAIYSAAKAYIFPSLYEGFGLPPLEAMRYAIPIMASNRSCLPEVLGNAAHYFDPEDISDILKALEEILTQPKLCAELINNGKAQIQKYSWEEMTKQTVACYEKQIQLQKAN